MTPKTPDWVLVLLLGFSLSLNVWLGWSLLEANRIQTVGKHKNLAKGDSVPTILGISGDDPKIISFSSAQPTVVYVLSPTCVWSDRNMANVRTLAALRSETFRFLGLSVRLNYEDYVREKDLPFPVYFVPVESSESLRLEATPQTIVVTKQGKVWKNWVGVWEGRLKNEVEGFFDVRLPGLLPDKKSDRKK